MHASPRHIIVCLSRAFNQVLLYQCCSQFTSCRFCHVTDCNVPFIRKVYIKFRTKRSADLRVGVGRRKGWSDFKRFFFVLLWKNVSCKYIGHHKVNWLAVHWKLLTYPVTSELWSLKVFNEIQCFDSLYALICYISQVPASSMLILRRIALKKWTGLHFRYLSLA